MRHAAPGVVSPSGAVIDLSRTGMCVEGFGKPPTRRRRLSALVCARHRCVEVRGRVAWVKRFDEASQRYRFGVRFDKALSEEQLGAFLGRSAPKKGARPEVRAIVNSDDPYEVLGVRRDASEHEIQRAFHELALELHPDVGGAESQQLFVLVNRAYAVLRDREARRKYDERMGCTGRGA